MRLRLVLADDHSVVLDGLKAVLGLEPDMEIVTVCTDGHEILDAVETHTPDVLVTDITMPGRNGLEAYEALKERGAEVPTVVLSATLTDSDVQRCLQSGVRGIVLKESAASTLVDAIRSVARGEHYIPPDLSARVGTREEAVGCSFRVLGGATLEGCGTTDSAASRRRHPLALMALLAASAPQGIGRDRIMELLWPDKGPGRAGNSLRQTLFMIRRDLGDDVLLPETAGGVRLNPAVMRVDLWDFRAALGGGRLREAVETYGGPFLDNFHIPGLPDFSHWVEQERQRIGRQYTEALDALASRAESEGRYDEAVSWRRKQAATDPYSSRVALALLKALTAAGDRPGALQFAKVYESIVQDHLEIDPDPRVVEFVRSLLEAPREEEGGAPGEPRSPGADAAEGVEPPGTEVSGAEVSGADMVESDAVPEEEVEARPAQIDVERVRGESVPGKRVSQAWALMVVMAGIAGTFAVLSTLRGPPPAESSAPIPMVVLGSAVTSVDGRDPDNRLVACQGPACPDEALPTDAYVVAKHSAYGAPAAGTGYIAPIPGGTAEPGPSVPCCSTMTFEREFTLPPDAASARISGSVLADNQAILSINGREFARHEDPESPSNYAGPPLPFSVAFSPDPSGTNRLQMTVWNGGGAVALQYQAVVTYDVRPDADGDGVPDDEDPYPQSDLRPTLVIGSCDTRVANQSLARPQGTTFADLVAGARATHADREELLLTVTSLVEGWVELGYLSEGDRDRILACVAEEG